MSDTQQGPTWWQAADHKWYPPEMHPDYQVNRATPPPGTPPPPGAPPPFSAYEPPSRSRSGDDALETKGFFRSLYDFSFSSFIMLRVIRVLYIVITVLYSIVAVVVFIAALIRHTPADIAIAIIGVPLGYLVYLTIARITMEVIMVVFNIGKDLRSIRERGERRADTTV
jgi:hypothetical protein